MSNKDMTTGKTTERVIPQSHNSNMKVGVYGMGRFGTLWATLLAHHPTQPVVLVGSRSNVPHPPPSCQTATLAQLAATDILFLTVSISALAEVLKKLAPLLSPHTIVCDTCSVKHYPCKLLKKIIPRTNHIIGTHPLFGPDSSNVHPSIADSASRSSVHPSTADSASHSSVHPSIADSAPHSSVHPPIAHNGRDSSKHASTVAPTMSNAPPQPVDTQHYTQQVALVHLRPPSPSYTDAITKCTDLLSGIGCQVMVMTATEHDKQVAQIQGLTHLIGRTLAMLELKPHQLRTLGYTKLLEVMQQTCNDSMELFIDLQRHNPYTRSMIRQVVRSLRTLQRKIDGAGRNHNKRRK